MLIRGGIAGSINAGAFTSQPYTPSTGRVYYVAPPATSPNGTGATSGNDGFDSTDGSNVVMVAGVATEYGTYGALDQDYLGSQKHPFGSLTAALLMVQADQMGVNPEDTSAVDPKTGLHKAIYGDTIYVTGGNYTDVNYKAANNLTSPVVYTNYAKTAQVVSEGNTITAVIANITNASGVSGAGGTTALATTMASITPEVGVDTSLLGVQVKGTAAVASPAKAAVPAVILNGGSQNKMTTITHSLDDSTPAVFMVGGTVVNGAQKAADVNGMAVSGIANETNALFFMDDVSYLTVSNLSITDGDSPDPSVQPAPVTGLVGVAIQDWCSNINIANCTVNGWTNQGVLATASDYITIDGCNIYNNGWLVRNSATASTGAGILFYDV
jgi:hypothetical protein